MDKKILVVFDGRQYSVPASAIGVPFLVRATGEVLSAWWFGDEGVDLELCPNFPTHGATPQQLADEWSTVVLKD